MEIFLNILIILYILFAGLIAIPILLRIDKTIDINNPNEKFSLTFVWIFGSILLPILLLGLIIHFIISKYLKFLIKMDLD